MRQARVGSVTQALLRAFCGQLIESRRARAIEAAIVRAATPTVAGTAPRPADRDVPRAMAPARLRSLGLHARRGSALVRLCRSFDPERLHGLATADVARLLERERGLDRGRRRSSASKGWGGTSKASSATWV